MTRDTHETSLDLAPLEDYGIRFSGRSGDNAFYTFVGDAGYGRLRVRSVSPGVTLMYNEYRLPRCSSAFNSNHDLLILDFCSEGSMDFTGQDGHASHFESGDLCIANRSGHAGEYRFPLSHYIGVTIGFDMGYLASHEAAQRAYPVNLRMLQAKFLQPGERRVLRKDAFAARICSGFYGVPAEMRQEYYPHLVCELLLYLDAIEPLRTAHIPTLLDQGNLDKVVALRNLMVQDLLRHYTISELAAKFDLPPSTLKTCFKEVYGEPVFSYMRRYRINRAAVMLVENERLSIADAAASVGYANPSKFSEAFREIMGSLPRAYRKHYADERTLIVRGNSSPS